MPNLSSSIGAIPTVLVRQPHHLLYLCPFLSIRPRRPHYHLPLQTSTRWLAFHSRSCLRTEILVPPRTLSHLQTSTTPSDDSKTQQMQGPAIRQGFCCEGPATGAHVLLANPPAAAELTTLLMDSGACATKSDDPGPSLQHSDMDLDLDVFMGLTDSDADAEGVTDDEVVVPSPTPSASHSFLRSSGTQDHPDGSMLGFEAPEHDADPDAGLSLGHARASSDRHFGFVLTSLTSLNSSVSGGEVWVDWPAQHGLNGTSVSPDTGVGEYAGDGTIDLSVLGVASAPAR